MIGETTCKHGNRLKPNWACVSCELDRTEAPYAELRRVLNLAHDQAALGKGKERHAIGDERFEDQFIVAFGARAGTNHFQVGQACKKLEESLRLARGAARREILGAINYAAAAYLLLEQQEAQESVLAAPAPGEG